MKKWNVELSKVKKMETKEGYTIIGRKLALFKLWLKMIDFKYYYEFDLLHTKTATEALDRIN